MTTPDTIAKLEAALLFYEANCECEDYHTYCLKANVAMELMADAILDALFELRGASEKVEQKDTYTGLKRRLMAAQGVAPSKLIQDVAPAIAAMKEKQMTITANVIDTEYRCVGEPDYLISTDADFAAVVKLARSLARSGTKCAIHWSRASDGQIAFWGPNGATFDPYWFE